MSCPRAKTVEKLAEKAQIQLKFISLVEAKGQITLKTHRIMRWHAQDNNGSALVIVYQGPKFTARAFHGPFRDDVLPRFRVTLKSEEFTAS